MKDFDKAWKEKDRKGYKFKVRGKSYELPHSAPASIMLELVRLAKSLGEDADIPAHEATNLAVMMVGKDQVDQMLEDGLTVEELNEILEWANGIYMPEPSGDGSGKEES